MVNGSALIPLLYHSGYWFANLSIGVPATKYELMVTSFSDRLLLYPDKYKVSQGSTNMNESWSLNGYWPHPDKLLNEQDGHVDEDYEKFTGDTFSDEVEFFPGVHTRLNISVSTNSTHHDHIGDGLLALRSVGVLCENKSIAAYRIGIAIPLNATHEDDKGTLMLGDVGTNIADIGPFFRTNYSEGLMLAELVVNGLTVQKDLNVFLTSGTPRIHGPKEDVANLFEQAGIQYSEQNGTLVGHFPCDKPPTIGFTLPTHIYSEKYIHANKTFNIPPTALISDKVGNNCTSVILGHEMGDFEDNWAIGLPFFRGRYIDFKGDDETDDGDGTIGIAELIERH